MHAAPPAHETSLGIGGGASLNLHMHVRKYRCALQDDFTLCVHMLAPRSTSFDVPHDTMEKLHLRRLIDARPLAIISLYVQWSADRLGYYTKRCGHNHWAWSLTDQQLSDHSSVDQEINKHFKTGSSDQGPNLAIKNFDCCRRWKYKAYCGDYPLRG